MVEQNYTQVRRCAACLIEKPVSCFFARKETGGLRAQCKECMYNVRLKSRPLRPSKLTATGKVCSQCKEDKPLSEFQFKVKARGIYRSYCKACGAKAHAGWNQKNRAAVNKQVAAWKKKNPAAVKAMAQARRARAAGSTGRFSASEIQQLYELQRGRCAACFAPLKGEYHIDHREALSRGGANEWSNLQLLHPRCNMKKGAKDPIEYMQLEHGMLL